MRVIAAAVRQAGRVWIGKRHPEIMARMREAGCKRVTQRQQGFVLEDGSFVSRDVARDHARESGQVDEGFSKVLTSEDLW